MKSNVQIRQFASHFNQYIDYRRKVEGTKNNKGKFSDLLSASSKDQSVQSDSKPNSKPILGEAKHISNAQANSLAKLAPVIQQAAAKHNVPVELICGVILQESNGNSKAVSHAGAKGLMQLMDPTAKRFGVTNSFDSKQNIEGGTKYLRFLLDRFEGNVELALAGYNAGEGRVEEYGNKIPPFKETQEYVPKVLGYTQTMIDILSEAKSLPPHARLV